MPVNVHYYVVKMGGSMKIQDPDELIHEIAWKDRGNKANNTIIPRGL